LYLPREFCDVCSGGGVDDWSGGVVERSEDDRSIVKTALLSMSRRLDCEEWWGSPKDVASCSMGTCDCVGSGSTAASGGDEPTNGR
jgi:hypothetical protein